MDPLVFLFSYLHWVIRQLTGDFENECRLVIQIVNIHQTPSIDCTESSIIGPLHEYLLIASEGNGKRQIFRAHRLTYLSEVYIDLNRSYLDLMRLNLYMYLCIRVCIRVGLYMGESVYVWCFCMYVFICMYRQESMCLFICVYAYSYMLVFLYAFIYACLYFTAFRFSY